MNKTKEPPQILRVKRKRTDDPLQALVMETSRRQIKRPRYVFRLKRTEENDINDSTTVLTASSNTQNNKPIFNIPSNKKENINIINNDNNNNNNNYNSNNNLTTKLSKNDKTSMQENNLESYNKSEEGPIELNPQLLEMLNDYLKDNDETVINNHVKPPKRRQSSITQDINNSNNILPKFDKDEVFKSYNNNAIDEDNDYVYDVYYRDKSISEQWEHEHIGYIKFDDEDFDKIDEKDNDISMNTDDEDSNDENFYRNDYPEDEDGGYEDESELESMGLDEPSDDQDDEFMILNDRRRFSRSEFLQSEGVKKLRDEDFEKLSDEIDEKPSLWGRTNEGIDYDQEENETDGEINFQRYNFFKSDKDDPTAIHRDRIFGKLQKMIEEQQYQQ